MNDSASVTSSKFPAGEPSKQWNIEELLHWSLNQYQQKTLDLASTHIESLRTQCENDCENAMYLHTLAVEMASKTNDGSRDAENMDPLINSTASNNNVKDSKPSASTATKDVTGPASTASNKAKHINPSMIEILVTTGPHANTKFILKPKPGAPCFIGRSKGKKFGKNGISLHKDAEVSTTHGTFLVEGGMALPLGSRGSESNNNNSSGPKFYFVDVGSTNGTFYEEKLLQPETRLLLTEGMDLKVGNSNLKITFG